ncbi:MAG: HAD family phosphatase [Pseudomonadota bacterium]
MPVLRGVLFDCDGVVVDSEPLIFEVTKKLFAPFGVDLQLDDVRPGIGAGGKYVSAPMEKYGITDVTVEEMLRRRTSAYLELAKEKLRPLPGFETLMEEIRKRGLKTALASSSSNHWVMESLKAVSIDPKRFDFIVDGDSIAKKKPNPDVFLEAAEGLNLKPAECLVIEDAAPGIEAAHRAGCRCVALTSTLPREKLTPADYLVDRLTDVIPILGRLSLDFREPAKLPGE